jgi:hypothetical protein
VIETVSELTIFPSKKDRAILFIYPVKFIVKPLPRACEAGSTPQAGDFMSVFQRVKFPLTWLVISHC